MKGKNYKLVSPFNLELKHVCFVYKNRFPVGNVF
jgi:hypothetical protein